MNEYKLSDIDHSVLPRLRPGIYRQIEETGDERITASRVEKNSRANSQRISIHLTVLKEWGLYEDIETEQAAENRYWLGDLQPAIDAAEEVFAEEIIDTLEEYDTEQVVSDVEDAGIDSFENGRKDQLVQPYGNEHSETTLEYFEDLGLIDSPEERTLTADDYDLDFVEETLTEEVVTSTSI